ncbi:MAG: glycoside hydrolase family 2 TIM barrel-domain containing protein, partial [Lacunisphaera sp.]|nr:glycoside hydrolase family 2 TIM barrel-domain containing protein [Lacunisphaera sp.]
APALSLLLALPVMVQAAAVTLHQDSAGRWQLRRDGRPLPVRGVGGTGQLPLAVAIGATTVRTWGADGLDDIVDGKTLTDRAHELGLTIVAGLWLEHERRGFDYGDPAQLQAQRDKVRADVRRHRGNPAIIAWGLGNEMEGPDSPTGHEAVWREIESLARIVKTEDPTRPVVTTIAGAARAKIQALRQFCPSVDILGLNLYGGAPMAAVQLDEAGWDRPFMLTEYGPRGPWEVVSTPWGAPIEPDTDSKVASYLAAYRMAVADPRGRCVGTFAFAWGQKQEATATWFGMFLRNGEKTPMIDIMAMAFTGHWPANRSPRTSPLRPVFANDRVRPGGEFEVAIHATDAENDPLTYEWIVQSESTDRRIGGDREAAPAEHPACIVRSDGPRVTVRMPATPGAYRLFVYVRDNNGGGCSENAAFFVQP